MKLLRGYIQQHTVAAGKYLQEFHASGNAEALHRFRVEMKKLRAALKLLRTLSPDSRKLKKSSQQLRKIFLHAGEIRRMQLRIAWMRKHRLSLIVHSSSLEQSLQLEIKQLQMHAKPYGKDLVRLADVLKEWAGKASSGAVKNYVKSLMAQAEADLVPKEKMELHEIRKRIKQLIYAQAWLKESNEMPALTRTQLRRLDALQEAIGEWHDLQDHLLWLESGNFDLHKNTSLRKAALRCKSTLEKLSAAAEPEIRRKMKAMKFPIR